MPEASIAYWAKDGARHAFRAKQRIREVADPRSGLGTTDNCRFFRQWFELDTAQISYDLPNAAAAAESCKTWFLYNKGGTYQKWYGN